MSNSNVLITTNGTWDGTSVINSNDAKAIYVDSVHLSILCYHDEYGRVNRVSHDVFMPLLNGGTIALFPGRFEVEINGRSLVVENTSHYAYLDSLDHWLVSYVNNTGDDLTDEIIAWHDKWRITPGENLNSYVNFVSVEFNYARNSWRVAISLDDGENRMEDYHTTFYLGRST